MKECENCGKELTEEEEKEGTVCTRCWYDFFAEQ
jgi:DNA-directed RNA polymerase subunit RPC12/RpoP